VGFFSDETSDLSLARVKGIRTEVLTTIYKCKIIFYSVHSPARVTNRTFRDLHRTLPQPCKARGRIMPGTACREVQGGVATSSPRSASAINNPPSRRTEIAKAMASTSAAISRSFRSYALRQPASGSVAAAWSRAPPGLPQRLAAGLQSEHGDRARRVRPRRLGSFHCYDLWRRG
jgi:hypothetical protein